MYIKPNSARLASQQSCIFIVNYLLLYVLVKFWCKLLEDGDIAETCISYLRERIHRFRIVRLLVLPEI